MACVVCACTSATPRPPGATPVEVRSGSLPKGPPPPRQGLPIPPLDVQWSPPVLVAGDMGALAAALAEHEIVAVHEGPRWARTTHAEPLGPLVRAVASRSRIAAVTTGSAERLLASPRLPVVRVDREDAAAPRYQHAGVALADDWNVGREVTGQAGAVLVVDDAPIELDEWRRQPARAQGGCDEALDALALGQEQSLARLETFLDHADRVLLRLYRAELEVLLPALEAELDAASGDPPADVEQAQLDHCMGATRKLLAQHGDCRDRTKRCTTAPRLFLMGGARIGMPEPEHDVASECAEIVGRDVAAELRVAGHDVAHAAQERLDPAWTSLADRLGTITEVHAALEDICTPRRRRFASADIDAARQRLVRIGETLASNELARPGAGWRFASVDVVERFHVPGVGAVTQLAQYDGGSGSPNRRILAEARALRQFVLDRARCTETTDGRPLVAMVIRSDGRTPTFLGYFFDEELACAGLGPRPDLARTD